MAIYHMSIKIGSKGKGQSAVAAAAYRSGDKLTDKETGLISDYTRKGGVVHSEISLCDNAPLKYADRETLWNAVHEIENKKNSRLCRISFKSIYFWARRSVYFWFSFFYKQ